MDILTTRDGGVMTIELNRPQKKNAITADMYGALAAALIEAREAPEIRAVMIVGKRDVFTAGCTTATKSRALISTIRFRRSVDRAIPPRTGTQPPT